MGWKKINCIWDGEMVLVVHFERIHLFIDFGLILPMPQWIDCEVQIEVKVDGLLHVEQGRRGAWLQRCAFSRHQTLGLSPYTEECVRVPLVEELQQTAQQRVGTCDDCLLRGLTSAPLTPTTNGINAPNKCNSPFHNLPPRERSQDRWGRERLKRAIPQVGRSLIGYLMDWLVVIV